MTGAPWAQRIDLAVAARVRATVLGLQKQDPGFTAGRFTEHALTAWCEKMEADHNGGQPWPVQPDRRLRPGARLG